MYLIGKGGGILSIPVEQKTEFYHLLVGFYETGDSEKLKDFLYPCITKSFTKTLGQRICMLRERAGMDRMQASQRLGISQERLFLLETDAEIPSGTEIGQILQYFGVEREVFLENTGVEDGGK